MAGPFRPAAGLLALAIATVPAPASDAGCAAPAVALPAVVDLGAVPRDRAQCLSGRLELQASRREAGALLLLRCTDPRVQLSAADLPLRAGRTTVNFRLDVNDPQTGVQTCSLEATIARGEERVALGALPVRWRVYDSAVAVRNWRAPEPMSSAAAEAMGRLEIQATPDLARQTVSLEAEFDDLPQGMTVSIAGSKVVLRGGDQAFDVPLVLRGARRGRYEGTLRVVAPEGAGAPEPLPLVLDIESTAVAAALLGEARALDAAGERFLHPELDTAALDEPAVFELVCERGDLPDGIRIDVQRRIRVKPGDTSTLVPIHVSGRESLPSGTWRPSLHLLPRTRGVIATPAALTLEVSVHAVPGRAIAYGVIACGLLLLVVLRIRGTLRRPARAPSVLAGVRA